MNKISEQIFIISFLDELEKTGTFNENIVMKLLREADSVAGSKGIRAGLKVFEQHRRPLFALPKGALKKPVPQVTYGEGVGSVQRFFAQELGDLAHGVGTVTKDIDKTKSITNNIGSVLRNFGNLVSNQLRGTRYKVLPASEVTRTGPGGSYIKGKGLLGKMKVFDRKIVGKTTAGNYIVKKRKAMLPLTYSVSPVGFGAGTFLLGSGKQDENLVDRTSAGLKETALWSVTPIVAQTKLISDILK